jgi:Tfp pilus assembly protein PilF
MTTTRVIAATISLAAVAGAMSWLPLPSVHAQAPKTAEVVIDLLAVKPGTVAALSAPPGDPFLLRLDNRAPGALYQVTVEEAGRAPQIRTLGLPFASMLRTLPIPSCSELQRREQELMAAVEEEAVPAKVGAIREEAQTSSCSMPKAMADLFIDQSRPLLRSYLLPPEQELKVTIERSAPDTKAVQRRWQVTLQARAPKSEAASATEEDWLVTEIARDVAEMAIYAKSRSVPDAAALAFAFRRNPDAAGAPRTFGISLRPTAGAPPLEYTVALADHVWSPGTYEPMARALLQRLKVSSSAAVPGPGSALAVLSDLRATVIEGENARVSAWLTRDMASAEAHEQAALVVAALALREAAGSFQDRRPALSRMGAHLAMAAALRAGKPMSPAGDFAETALLMMVGRRRDALARLDAAAKAGLSPEARPWASALRTWSTGDWRILKDPARASLLERWAQFQALSDRLGGLSALELLKTGKPESVPDWGRYALQGGGTVEEGNLFASGAVDLELREIAEVWKRQRASGPEPAPPVPALNEEPGRCIGHDASGRSVARVIDWGAWARFSQRHLLHVLLTADYHLRAVLGLNDEANDLRRKARQDFGNLLLFPFLEVRWQSDDADRVSTAVPPGQLRALRPGLVDACPAAVRVLRAQPEAVSPASWELVDRRCSRERDTGLLPRYPAWFSPVVPTGTAYAAYSRLATGFLSKDYDTQKMVTLLQYSPFDAGIVRIYVARKFGDKPNPKEVAPLVGPLLEYDLSVMKWWAGFVEDDVAAYRLAYEPVCRLDPDSCLTLAWYLADRDLDAAAVPAFERAVKEGRNRVGIVGLVGWLMDYYFDHQRPDDALKLARMGEEVHSTAGLRLMARLMERTGRYREAESYYKKIVERYDFDELINQFYVRYEQRIGDGRYRAEAQEALKKLFPQGLQRATLADLGAAPAPGRGYLVAWKPSVPLARIGLKTRDVIVAMDGYRIDNRPQYETVLRFTDKRDVALIVWREGRFVELKGQMRRERYGPSATTSREVADSSPGL